MEYQLATENWTPAQARSSFVSRAEESSSAGASSAPPQEVVREGVRICGLDLDWYVRQIKKPVLYGSAFAVSATVLAAVLPGVWADGADALSFVVKLAVWGVIGWHSVRRTGSSSGAAAVAAGMAGLAIGFVLALLRLLVVREVWTLFNLIVEPVVSGVFGYLAGGAAALAHKPFTPLPERHGIRSGYGIS